MKKIKNKKKIYIFVGIILSIVLLMGFLYYSTSDTVNLQIAYSFETPDDQIALLQDYIFVNVSVIEENFANITFSLFNSTSEVNTTTYDEKIFFINWTGLKKERYKYNVTIFDNNGNYNIAETRSVHMLKEGDQTIVVLETNFGEIEILLYEDMPITAGNFKKLVEQGFYDGTIFHRVMANFMIQGGDPTGTGTGGPGYKIKDEFVEGHSNLRGTISMANSGPNSGGSQFFINVVDNEYLDFNKQPLSSKHPVFGEVVSGMNIVDKISKVRTNSQAKPLEEVKILKARIK